MSDSPGSESGASADATSTTLRGLKAATRYGVTVRAYNAAGTGPLSPPHYRHTLESRKLIIFDSILCYCLFILILFRKSTSNKNVKTKIIYQKYYNKSQLQTKFVTYFLFLIHLQSLKR